MQKQPDSRIGTSPSLISLRRAQSEDAAVVRDIVLQAYAKWVSVLGREPKPMMADYDAAVRDHLVDVLHRDGKPSALIEMKPQTDHLLIVNVAVLPDQQGHGHGRTLLAHAEKLALSLQLKELRLYTSDRMTENVKLYERVGFRIERKETVSSYLGVFVYKTK